MAYLCTRDLKRFVCIISIVRSQLGNQRISRKEVIVSIYTGRRKDYRSRKHIKENQITTGIIIIIIINNNTRIFIQE